MASQRQIDANRRNAQKSTGPKTQPGRERSRLNALKHGLSRKRPTPAPASPLILPLAQAMAGEGMHAPEVLALAEHIAVESLTLLTIRHLRTQHLARAADPRATPPIPLSDLRQLERYESQASARRSRAATALARALGQPEARESENGTQALSSDLQDTGK